MMTCRGTKTSINIDNIEERKIQEHFNFVTAKLEKLHKNLMWNMFIGRSYLDKNEKVSRVMDEVSLDSNEVGDFDVGNPKTWNKECLKQIEATLEVNEIPYDGIVSLFSVLNDANDRDVDSDEVKISPHIVMPWYNMMLLPGCLGARESVGLPLYQLTSPETPQPGGRAGQAGAGPHQQEGPDPGQEQSGLRGLLEVILILTFLK